MPEVPDIENIVADYLRDDAGVSAIVGRRVVAEHPDNTDDPWVLLTQLDGPQDLVAPVDYLVGWYLQFDCYAGKTGGYPQARDLRKAVRAAIGVIDEVDHSGASISAGRLNADGRIPDDTFKPARQRYVLTATVTAHPVEES